ncbi:MAG: F0F1 ATP synthase subunit epsilon [Sulfuricella sp.]|nr:F0F1 ATP synthase subunit epsilon [Sulfuricella sp.]
MSAPIEAAILQVNIVSLQGEIYSGKALRVAAPALLGEVGIHPRHAPMLTPLKEGEVRILTPGNTLELIYVSGGLLEVQPTLVTILADTAARAKGSDQAAATEARRLTAEAMQHLDRLTAHDRAYAELLVSIAEMMAERERLRKRRRW